MSIRIAAKLLLISCLFAVWGAAAQAQNQAANIESCHWLVGHWRGANGPTQFEETWSAPRAGAMLGMFRMLNQDKITVLEILTLSQNEDQVQYQLRHFGGDLRAWEDDPLRLVATKLGDNELILENSTDGDLRRITYQRKDDTLTARVETTRDGKPVSFQLVMKKTILDD